MMQHSISLLFLCLVPFAMAGLWTDSKNFHYKGHKVCMVGSNAAWSMLGFDFGTGKWKDTKYQNIQSDYKNYFKMVHDNGGNSLRLFLHNVCEKTPHFDGNKAPKYTDGLADDVKSLLDMAKSYNVFAHIVLFNGAEIKGGHEWKLQGIIKEDWKRQAYIDNVLKPLLDKIKWHSALGSIEVFNEMEGSIWTGGDSEKCFNSTHLKNSGAGFAKKMNEGPYSVKQMMRTINHIADAIHKENQYIMVTSGSWNPKSNTDNFGHTNHYSDHCLKKAGGREKGYLDFYSIHTYAKDSGFKYDKVSPFYTGGNNDGRDKGDYGLDKPLVIAEFTEKQGENWKIEDQYNHCYWYGYAGCFGWMYKTSQGDHDQDQPWTVNKGIRYISDKTREDKCGVVKFTI